MDPALWSRAARRRLGLSQRGFAAVAGISQAQINALERGHRVPTTALLDRVLGAADLDLMLCERVSSVEHDALVAHLRLSLTERLRLALDEPSPLGRHGVTAPWRELLALAGSAVAVVLDRPLALRLWLPAGPVTPIRVRVHRPRGDLPPLAAVEAVVTHAPRPAGVVPVNLRRGRRVWVEPPAELAVDPVADQLRLADLLLHDQAARDDAGRRRPPHRDPDESAETTRLECTKGSERIVLPEVTEGRGWRLDAAASLAQLLGPDGRLLR